LGCAAPEILFLDDSRLNVAAANTLGITAFEAKGRGEAEFVFAKPAFF
jgi:FMN phosphatase YigB (HAD superfamily)